MFAHHVLERERGVARHAVPRLGGPEVHVVEAVQVVVLDVPREPTEHHPDVEHRRGDPGDILRHEPQQRSGAPSHAAHVPRRLPKVRRRPRRRLLLRRRLRLRGARGESRARHVAAILDHDGAVGRCAPEEHLVVERGELPGGREVEAGEERLAGGAGLGLELRERVAVGGPPHGLEPRARAARAEADLLVAGGEGRRAVVRVERGEGAGEVGEGGLLRRRGQRRHDLADAVRRRGGLDLEDVGDGIGELGGGGAELGRDGQRSQPRGHRFRRRGGGRRRGPHRRRVGDSAAQRSSIRGGKRGRF